MGIFTTLQQHILQPTIAQPGLEEVNVQHSHTNVRMAQIFERNPLLASALTGFMAGILTQNSSFFSQNPSPALLQNLSRELARLLSLSFEQCTQNPHCDFIISLQEAIQSSPHQRIFQLYFESPQGKRLLTLCKEGLRQHWSSQQLCQAFVESEYRNMESVSFFSAFNARSPAAFVHDVKTLFHRWMGGEENNGADFARAFLGACRAKDISSDLRNYIERQGVISGVLESATLSGMASSWSGHLLSVSWVALISRTNTSPLVKIGSALLCGAASSLGQVFFQAYWATRHMSFENRLAAWSSMEWQFKSAILSGMFCGFSELVGAKVLGTGSSCLGQLVRNFINFSIFNVSAEMLSDTFMNRLGLAAAYVNSNQENILAPQTLIGKWFLGAGQEIVATQGSTVSASTLHYSFNALSLTLSAFVAHQDFSVSEKIICRTASANTSQEPYHREDLSKNRIAANHSQTKLSAYFQHLAKTLKQGLRNLFFTSFIQENNILQKSYFDTFNSPFLREHVILSTNQKNDLEIAEDIESLSFYAQTQARKYLLVWERSHCANLLLEEIEAHVLLAFKNCNAGPFDFQAERYLLCHLLSHHSTLGLIDLKQGPRLGRLFELIKKVTYFPEKAYRLQRHDLLRRLFIKLSARLSTEAIHAGLSAETSLTAASINEEEFILLIKLLSPSSNSQPFSLDYFTNILAETHDSKRDPDQITRLGFQKIKDKLEYVGNDFFTFDSSNSEKDSIWNNEDYLNLRRQRMKIALEHSQERSDQLRLLAQAESDLLSTRAYEMEAQRRELLEQFPKERLKEIAASTLLKLAYDFRNRARLLKTDYLETIKLQNKSGEEILNQRETLFELATNLEYEALRSQAALLKASDLGQKSSETNINSFAELYGDEGLLIEENFRILALHLERRRRTVLSESEIFLKALVSLEEIDLKILSKADAARNHEMAFSFIKLTLNGVKVHLNRLMRSCEEEEQNLLLNHYLEDTEMNHETSIRLRQHLIQIKLESMQENIAVLRRKMTQIETSLTRRINKEKSRKN